MIFFSGVLLIIMIDSADTSAGWKDQHPQQRWKLQALRLPCYSCMSPYLEDNYQYISHLYRKPMSFDLHCDRHSLDRNFLYVKNCSDMCVTLRINDVVGGRRRHGYVRGCLSDIHGYNHSIIRALGDHSGCIGEALMGEKKEISDTTARELFLPTAQRQELEPSRLTMCGCHGPLCNQANGMTTSLVLLLMLFVILRLI